MPALCGSVQTSTTGTVAAPGALELSGLVVSPEQPGVLWTHNDSGDSARVFALRPDGASLGTFAVPGASASDWEDLAARPAAGARPAQLFIGDIGDNGRRRSEVYVYRVGEPVASAGGGTTATASRITLRYPDGAHDAEALFVEPGTGDVFIVTKEGDDVSGVYRAPDPAVGGAAITLQHVTDVDVGGLATGADINRTGDVIVVRTYDGVLAWERLAGEALSQTLRRAPCEVDVDLDEPQGEAIALEHDGRAFLTVSEGAAPPLHRTAVR